MSLSAEDLQTLYTLSLSYQEYANYMQQITYIGILLSWISAGAFRSWKGAIIALIFSIYMPYSLSQIKKLVQDINLDIQNANYKIESIKITKIEKSRPWYMTNEHEIIYIHTAHQIYQLWSSIDIKNVSNNDTLQAKILIKSKIIFALNINNF